MNKSRTIADETNMNLAQDPAADSVVIDSKKAGPDFSRGRSFSKNVVNVSNLESIHSSKSMIAVEHETKGDVYNAQLQRGRIKIVRWENSHSASPLSFEGYVKLVQEYSEESNQDGVQSKSGKRRRKGMVLSAK